MRLTWLPYKIVFEVDDAHGQIESTFMCSTLEEILSRAPECVGACVEDKRYRGFLLLRMQNRRFITIRGMILGEISTDKKTIYLFGQVFKSLNHKDRNLIFDCFDEFDISCL